MGKLTHASKPDLETPSAGSEAQTSARREAPVGRDVRHLLRAAGAHDHRYQELHSGEQQRQAAGRWPLLKATDVALALRRQQETSADVGEDQ